MNLLKRAAWCVWWAPAFLMMVLTSFVPPSDATLRGLWVFHKEMAHTSKGYAAWNSWFWAVLISWSIWALVLFSGD